MITKLSLPKSKGWLKAFSLSTLLIFAASCADDEVLDNGEAESTKESVLLSAKVDTTFQAEDYDEDSGDGIKPVGGTKVGYIKDGRWIRFDDFDHSGATSISVSASSDKNGGTIEFRKGSETGNLLAEIDVPNTGGWNTFKTYTADITGTSSNSDLYIVFTSSSSDYLLDIDSFTFNSSDTTTGDGSNLALNGTAEQSSNYSSTLGLANLAIDGNTNGVWNNKSVTHTQSTYQPWWQVRLGNDTNIEEIVIWNRTNCCMSRLSNFDVFVYNNAGTLVHKSTITDTPSPSVIVKTGGVTGNRVRIKLKGTNPLSLAEVQVFGESNGEQEEEEEEEEEEEFEPGDLDPNKTPAENFDLSQWKLTPSSGNDYSVSQLNNNLVINNQFYTASDGGMVFKNYPKGSGTTTNSDYSRVEFREMLDTSADDTSISKNNWVFSTSSNTNKTNSGGVGGKLTATLKVDRVTKTSTSTTQEGRIVIGQIHASDNEPCRLYYKLMDGDSKGAVYFIHEDSNGDEHAVNMIGDYAKTGDPSNAGDYTGASEPSDGIPLGEVFSYKIEVIGTMLYVDIYRDGAADVSESYNMSSSGYANDWMYFKAGLYSQNKTVQSSTDYEQVTFYALENTH